MHVVEYFLSSAKKDNYFTMRHFKLACLAKFNPLPLLLLVVWSVCGSNTANASVAKVVFFCPTPASSPYFKVSTEVMRAAAKNLDLDLEIIYGDNNAKTSQRKLEQLFSRDKLPDYLLLLNRRNSTANIMSRADALGIHTILFHGAYTNSSFRQLREGPNALKHWIGQVLPDEVQSGWLLTERLVHAARAANAYDKNGVIQVVGINGSLNSTTSRLRDFGMRTYVTSQPDVNLQKVLHANWRQNTARVKTTQLLRRYEDTTVIWAANNTMAIGATEACIALACTPGEDMFIAGMNWLPSIFEPMRQNKVVGTVGGYIFDAAWAMVLAFDHHNGSLDNFVDERTKSYFIGKDDIDAAETLMHPTYWNAIDFSQYSKTKNGNAIYNFDAKQLLLKASES